MSKKYLALFLLISFNSFSKELICDYNFGNSTLSFDLSKENKTFEKKFSENGLDYKIFVKLDELKSYDNYLVVSDTKYKMTYLLDCSINE